MSVLFGCARLERCLADEDEKDERWRSSASLSTGVDADWMGVMGAEAGTPFGSEGMGELDE
jgi:hypothetical protein